MHTKFGQSKRRRIEHALKIVFKLLKRDAMYGRRRRKVVVDRFYIALFSALEQTRALACDFRYLARKHAFSQTGPHEQ